VVFFHHQAAAAAARGDAVPGEAQGGRAPPRGHGDRPIRTGNQIGAPMKPCKQRRDKDIFCWRVSLYRTSLLYEHHPEAMEIDPFAQVTDIEEQ
jgi:hypothetical protein